VFTALIVLNAAGCKPLQWIDKHSPPEVPGEEKARLERLKKEAGPPGTNISSVLRVSPQALDFGTVPVRSARTQAITIANPSAFDVTVVGVVLDGEGFTLENRTERVTLPAHDQFELTIRFRPLERRAYTGRVVLEIDAAGARFTRVLVRGSGVS
jgi:hypothetical protein